MTRAHNPRIIGACHPTSALRFIPTAGMVSAARESGPPITGTYGACLYLGAGKAGNAMNTQDTIEAVNAMDCPEARLEGMVYQVWEDGEITLQKGGNLLWQRNLHCTAPGSEKEGLPRDALRNKYNGHSYIFAASHDDAEKARDLILKRG